MQSQLVYVCGFVQSDPLPLNTDSLYSLTAKAGHSNPRSILVTSESQDHQDTVLCGPYQGSSHPGLQDLVLGLTVNYLFEAKFIENPIHHKNLMCDARPVCKVSLS